MVTMKVFDSRADWLAGRSGRIGGSEASCIVGMNPYQTNIDLWKIKTGRLIPEDISESPFVKYGSQAEMHLRGLFRLDFHSTVWSMWTIICGSMTVTRSLMLRSMAGWWMNKAAEGFWKSRPRTFYSPCNGRNGITESLTTTTYRCFTI